MWSSWLEHRIRPWWWVCLFVIGAYAIYERSRAAQTDFEQSLMQRQAQLLQALRTEELRHASLEEVLASQDDPMWVEQTLMRRLGLHPEGTTKVVFDDSGASDS